MEHLFFICPTDHLEPVINEAFQDENYFWTSLGNSVEFDTEMLLELYEWIQTKEIRRITLVLSSCNSIIRDAIERQDYSQLSDLNPFYHRMAKQKEQSEVVWQRCDQRFLLLSYHLNQKIAELKQGLGNFLIPQITIEGKIFNRKKNQFCDVYSDLICRDWICVN
ncbi:MAG: hypothetical protein AAFQ98_00975 [Bacteroidota bacterium]